MAEIHADYLGGDPLAPAGHGASGLLLTSGGGLSFRGAAVDVSLRSHRVALAVAAADMRAVSVGSADRVRAAGGAGLDGPREAAADAAGGRDHLLVLAGRRDDTDFLITFGVGADGARLVNAMQRARAERGAPVLPRLEDLGDGEDDHRLLLEIRGLLREQARLLRERTGPAGPREA